jgi:hypothetical protein
LMVILKLYIAKKEKKKNYIILKWKDQFHRRINIEEPKL